MPSIIPLLIISQLSCGKEAPSVRNPDGRARFSSPTSHPPGTYGSQEDFDLGWRVTRMGDLLEDSLSVVVALPVWKGLGWAFFDPCPFPKPGIPPLSVFMSPY